MKSRFARKFNHQRALCEDLKVISAFFDELQNTKDQYGIVDEVIYNRTQ